MPRLLTSRDERDCALDELEDLERVLAEQEQELSEQLALNWFMTEERKAKIAILRRDIATIKMEIEIVEESLYAGL